MARPQSRQDLKEYALRKLGAPVIEINVDDSQLEDRIDDAIQIFNEYHFDGVEKAYYKYLVTATDVANGYIDSNALTMADGAVGPELEDGSQIISVLRVFQFAQSATNNLFSVQYQLALNDVMGIRNPGSLTQYTITQQHISMMQDILDPEKRIRFSRVTNRIYLDTDWDEDVKEGRHLVFECYVSLDPEKWTEIYNDILLKKYLVASFKQQWGANLSKYQNVTLPGGLSYNGAEIYQQASAEMDTIEETLADKYELPPDFMIG